jgi:UDP-2,3-diacylglucosamine pyrophosphatase LpxH
VPNEKMSALPTLPELLNSIDAASNYGDPKVKLSSNGEEVLFVSDLHMGPGRTSDGCYNGTENFFADASFRRCLEQGVSRYFHGPVLLVVNGDLVDFIRTTRYPVEAAEFDEWQRRLQQIGIAKSVAELRGSISAKERQFGLQTDDYKSVWKLEEVVRGHEEFFIALASWLGRGNRLLIVKGNHDLEWYWAAVRNCLRLELAERIAASDQPASMTLEQALSTVIAPQLTFVDNALVIDDLIYVEHGHRFDHFTAVIGNPVLAGGRQLNLPFGSFFNRYVLNQVELEFPYTDNVRPTTDLLPMLIKERFFVALKLLLYHVPLAMRTIPKGYYRYIFGKVAVLAAALLIPLLVAAVFLLSLFPQLYTEMLGVSKIASTPAGKVGMSFISMMMSYFMSRMVAYFQLSEPDSLEGPARALLEANPGISFITFGHTHNPDQFLESGRYYFNTGTWIPIIEIDTAQVREDQTYTLLFFARDAAGKLRPHWLQRWDDEANRLDDLVIRKQKGS